MAKRNSTKTATKEALQNSEPKLQTFKGWQGIYIGEVGPNINVFDGVNNIKHTAGDNDNIFLQSDLKSSFLMLQNNVKTTDSRALETRYPTIELTKAANFVNGESYTITGISCLIDNYLLYVAENDNNAYRLFYIDVTRRESQKPNQLWDCEYTKDDTVYNYRITRIGRFQNVIIALAYSDSMNEHRIFVAEIKYRDDNSIDWSNIVFETSEYISDPSNTTSDITSKAVGCTLTTDSSSEDAVVRYHVTYCLTNRFGSTETQATHHVFYVDIAPEEMTSSKRVELTVTLEKDENGKYPEELGVDGIDLYYAIDEYTDLNFMGRIDLSDESTWTSDHKYKFNWLGGMQDTSIWQDVSLYEPTENTTRGVDAEYFDSFDGRLFFWGGSNKQRLYVGGNTGHEYSVARGWGGAYIDIDPGSSSEIMNCHRFKTSGGSAAITVLCNNHNSTRTRRYNIVETTTTLTNELTTKSYYAEEISNVVGCVSHYGSGVWRDGLYTLDRYGLMVTTHTMEYNTAIKNNELSTAVKSLFTDLPASSLSNARLFFLDNTMYISFANNDSNLDNIILAYDTDLQSWFTYSIDCLYGQDEHIKEFIAIDSILCEEGLGIITDKRILFIPITGERDITDTMDRVVIETHDLAGRVPPQATVFICQGEFRFDWFIGDLTIEVEGVDYYGRPFTVSKHVSSYKIENKMAVYMRIDRMVETYRVKIHGNAQFKLTHFIFKAFSQSNKINVVYGFDSHNWHTTHHHGETYQHHEIDNYNNLKACIVP